MKHFLPLILSVAALFASAVTASAAGGEAHDGVGTEISVQNTNVSVRVSHSGFEVHNASQEPCDLVRGLLEDSDGFSSTTRSRSLGQATRIP